MKLLTLKLNGRFSRYLLFRGEALPACLEMSNNDMTRGFESMGSSRFLMSRDTQILAKIVVDKWSRRKQPFKWLLQGYIEKRYLLQTDARME